MASEREPSHSRAAQASILSIISCGKRAPTKGPCGGRPGPRLRFILFIRIDFRIILFIIMHSARKEVAMQKQEPRKLREELTEKQKAEARRIGSLDYRSHRKMDHRVLKFIPSKKQH
jgi:hypothetical protein